MSQQISIKILIVVLLSGVALFPVGAIAKPQERNAPDPTGRADSLASETNPSTLPKTIQDLKLPPPKGMSLQEVLNLATRYSRELEQSRLSFQKAQAALQEQKASLFPTLDATAQSNYNRNSFAETQNDTLVLSVGVQANYTLFDFGQRNTNILIQAVQVRSAELEVNRLTQQIRLDVAQQYYDLQDAGEQVRINQAAVENAQRSFQDTQLRERAGLGTRFDTLQAQTTLSNNQVNLYQARTDLQVAQRKIAQKLGIAQTTQIAASDPIQIVGAWPLSLEQTILNAFEKRVELNQQRLAQESGQMKVKLAKTQKAPQVNLSAGYTLQESPLTDSSLSNPLQDDLSVSLKLNWRLFDGGAAKAQANQARADTAIAVSEFANQRDQIRLDTETAFLTLQSQQQQMSSAQVGLTSAQAQLRLARLRFNAGVGTQLDVLNAQNQLAQAESNVSKAITGYNKAFVQLQRAINTL
jgi:outer membrane protein TolC